MKRGTPEHPKTLLMMFALKIPKPHACGILELLWHFTAKYAPTGAIGKYSDSQLAQQIGWEGDPMRLIEVLVDCGWLDRHPKHRLVVHDWHEHADNATKKHMGRSSMAFVSKPGKHVPPPGRTIYFIQASVSKHIKIGFTESAVETRLADLQVGCPEKLEILGSFAGTQGEEHSLHNKFAKHNVSGEWFRDCEELRSFLALKMSQRQPSAAIARQRRTARASAVAVAGALPSPAGAKRGAPTPPPPALPVAFGAQIQTTDEHVREGYALITELAKATGRDPMELIREASTIPRSGYYLLQLDGAKPEHLLRTVNRLRDMAKPYRDAAKAKAAKESGDPLDNLPAGARILTPEDIEKRLEKRREAINGRPGGGRRPEGETGPRPVEGGRGLEAPATAQERPAKAGGADPPGAVRSGIPRADDNAA